MSGYYHKYWFAIFIDRCPRCDDFSHIWEDLAEADSNPAIHNVTVAMVDCSTEKTLCTGSNIEKF